MIIFGDKDFNSTMKRFFIIMAAALCLCACARQVPGQVKVTGGTIQGIVLDDMTQS